MKKILLVANVSKEHVRKFHIPFIEFMKKKGYQVDVACNLDEEIPECDFAIDLPCDRNPFKGGLCKSIRVLKKVINDNQYDIVHCNTITGSVVGRLAASPFRKKGLKVFYTNHGLHFFEGASIIRWITGYPMEKMLASQTDLLITINHSDCEMAKRYLSDCKAIESIHGIGVNLDKFRDLGKDYNRKAYRDLEGLSEKDFVLIYVAELNENKNQIALVRSLEYLIPKIPQIKLLLVGPDHENGKLKKIVDDSGLEDVVKFLGWRNDIAELLHMSDVYVASSKSEGLGLNLIEAMAADVPVVALKNRGHCEIIDHGANGFLVEQGDYEGFAEFILKVYQDLHLREKLIKQAQKDISKYEVNNILEELYDIYLKYS